MSRLTKGQVFLADFVASIALFSVFLMLFGLLWNTSIEKFDATNTVQNRGEYTFSLLRTEGAPEDWNASNVEVPGLYDGEGYLSKSKFLELKSLPESRLRTLLKTQGYILELKYLNGSTVTAEGDKLRLNSSKLPSNSSVYTHNEIAVTSSDKKRVILDFLRWDNNE